MLPALLLSFVVGHSRFGCPTPRSPDTNLKTGPCGGSPAATPITIKPGVLVQLNFNFKLGGFNLALGLRTLMKLRGFCCAAYHMDTQIGCGSFGGDPFILILDLSCFSSPSSHLLFFFGFGGFFP